ncbi:MAG: hypothetical protein KAX20_00075 [Candidatus Omnitrophica bacterium]|nr:hypothetical protein [Candidatus Omnitrophota bacterium]
MSNKIAFIGDRSTILPFSGLGASVFPLEKDDDLKKLKGFNPTQFAIIFVTEETRKAKKDFFDKLGEKIVIIPSLKGKRTAQLERIEAAIRRATGSTK